MVLHHLTKIMNMFKNILFISFCLIVLNCLGQIKVTKMLIIEDDGIGVMKLLLIDRSNSDEEFFDFIINKDGFKTIDTIIANNYKVLNGEKNDIIRFYDKTFSIGDFFYFSENNLKVSKDSNNFKLTNKNRVTEKSKGLTISNIQSNMEIGIAVPQQGYEITKVKAKPNSINIYKDKKIVTFSGKDLRKMIYNIEYKKVKFDTNYSAKGKKEVYRKRMSIDKKLYQIEIWDNEKQDGDIINIYFNKKLAIHEYVVQNKPILIPLELSSAKKEKLTIHFESVSEGKIKPNTVFFRIFGNGIDETIDLTTDAKTNSIIEFTINHKK